MNNHTQEPYWKNYNNRPDVKERRKQRYQAKKAELKAYYQQWYANGGKEKQQAYNAANKEKNRADMQRYYQDNKEVYRERGRKYLPEYCKRDYVRERNRSKYHTNIQTRLRMHVRVRLRTATKGKASARTLDLLGCTLTELKEHLEKQFKPGMSWDNHSRTGWHIDHIKPCASFDLTDANQLKECFHYTNLQPLWAKDNIVKSDKL